MSRLPLRKIFATWWPLAASWLFMGAELPMISAVMARLADPKIHLAAYGGIVFPLALIIEAPIIMLLAASTALSKDTASYKKIYRFMMWAGGLLTAMHFLIAYTPLYYLVVVRLMGVPEEIVEPARLGLMIMIPWTWTIAYRRYHQGVLIRFGYARAVGVGTAIRLVSNASMLIFLLMLDRLLDSLTIPGIVVGTSGIAAGVIAEAIYAGLRVRPVLRGELQQAPGVEPALTWRTFSAFYVPLVLTSLINMIAQPAGPAAISRMPFALESLAALPVVSGLTFMFRSLGFAYNEVVVALLEQRGSTASLRKFATILAGATTTGIVLVAATPLSKFWFVQVSGLDPELATLARGGLWAAALWPGLSVLQNWFQGVLVNERKTYHVTVSVVILVIFTVGTLIVGTTVGKFTGLYVGMIAFVSGQAAQVVWLWWASRPVLAKTSARDQMVEEMGTLVAAAD
ncbi:MAG TPA: hypothetical protein VI451_15155 [Anaerolineales bacterium]|nr:hypothetical protein [Anaerolineales bacterium]